MLKLCNKRRNLDHEARKRGRISRAPILIPKRNQLLLVT
jgi:hypothetical protein